MRKKKTVLNTAGMVESPKEKDIIIVLLDKPLKRKEIAERLNVSNGSLSIYFKKLLELGLINNDNGLYSIREEMLKRWLKNEYEQYEYYPYR